MLFVLAQFTMGPVAMAIAVLLTSVGTSSAELLDVPRGYMLDVTPTCTDGSSDATLVISSDLDIKYSLICKYDGIVGFLKEENVSVSLSIKYTGATQGDENCYFEYNENTGVYNIKLNFAYRLPGSSAYVRQHTHLITCTTNDHKEANFTQTGEEGPFPDPRTIEYKGSVMTEDVTLTLTDVMGNAISNSIPYGKKVILEGSSSVPIVPVDCKVMSGSGEHYILWSGCGDGLTISSDAGFTTNGNTTTSPIINMFKVGDNSVTFSCTFMKCSASCDGSSCKVIAKRSVDDEKSEMIEAKTKPLFVKPKLALWKNSPKIASPDHYNSRPISMSPGIKESGLQEANTGLVYVQSSQERLQENIGTTSETSLPRDDIPAFAGSKDKLPPMSASPRDIYSRILLILYMMSFLLVFLSIILPLIYLFVSRRVQSQRQCRCQHNRII